MAPSAIYNDDSTIDKIGLFFCVASHIFRLLSGKSLFSYAVIFTVSCAIDFTAPGLLREYCTWPVARVKISHQISVF